MFIKLLKRKKIILSKKVQKMDLKSFSMEMFGLEAIERRRESEI